MLNAYDVVNAAWNEGLKPPIQLTVDEWADAHRVLSTSSSPQPGPWRTERTPYLKQIMEGLSPGSPARLIAFMKGSQVGATECSLNWVGYVVDKSPGSMLIVLPSQDTAKEWSTQRLSQLTEDTPAIRGKIIDQRRRDSGNTAFSKRFPGGHLKLAWSSSAKKLRSTPAGYVLADEVDGFKGDVEDEGDPVALLARRLTNFPRGKFFAISTPTLEHTSRILRLFRRGDQRYYFLPCPFCRHYQRLVFGQLKWEWKKPETVGYECISCSMKIPERFKTQMLAEGRWIATASLPHLAAVGLPEDQIASLEPIFAAMAEAKVWTFHLSALYSPIGWYSWVTVADDWEQSENDTAARKVFVNTVLGECWKEKGEAPDWKRIFDRTETYQRGRPPKPVLFLTAGADVQPDRIEAYVYGWDRTKGSWLVDQRIYPGDPTRPEVWLNLDRLLAEQYEHESGVPMVIRRLCIDSGYATQHVYDWARRHRFGKVSVIKGGSDSLAAPVGMAHSVDITVDGKKLPAGIKVQVINTSHWKFELYDRLRMEPPNWETGEAFPPQYFHLCAVDDTQEVCKQLCAEHIVTRYLKGYTKREWEKIRPRNEALDCWVYARVGAVIEGIDRFLTEHWALLEQALAQPRKVIVEKLKPASERIAQPKRARTVTSPWMNE